MPLTFIIFQAIVSTYLLSALQTEKIREEDWFGKRLERFLKSTLPLCIRVNFSDDCGAPYSLVCFWHLGVRSREG